MPTRRTPRTPGWSRRDLLDGVALWSEIGWWHRDRRRAAFGTATVACCDLLERFLRQLALPGGQREHEVTYAGRILDHADVNPLRDVEPRLFENGPGVAHETRLVRLVTPRPRNDLADRGAIAGASLHRKPPVERAKI